MEPPVMLGESNKGSRPGYASRLQTLRFRCAGAFASLALDGAAWAIRVGSDQREVRNGRRGQVGSWGACERKRGRNVAFCHESLYRNKQQQVHYQTKSIGDLQAAWRYWTGGELECRHEPH
jgi:hypothetical protein